ncbi:hypothetical protein, partial [Neobacillus notoginsengisoli]|uniref:hypothetical protein n=1 Tax=Neobacillus notoginsengisoli TaxID=1578198 RepID=UPI00195E0966
LTYGLMRGNRKRTCPLVWLSKVEHPETRGQEGQSLIPVFYSTDKLHGLNSDAYQCGFPFSF